MAKTKLTKEIEAALINRAISKSQRFALECPIGKGDVDFITQYYTDDFDIPYFNCYEIKISESDFNSEYGHNFNGDYNYYVVTKELWEKIKSKKTTKYKKYWYPRCSTGFIVYYPSGLRQVKESKLNWKHEKVSLERRYYLMNQMLMKWCTGSMTKYLKRYGIKLRNE